MRILLDVNVLVRANELSHGPARLLLIALVERDHTLLMSAEMLVELATVLRYPRLRSLYDLSEEQIYSYVQFLRAVSEPVILNRMRPLPMRDAKDIAVLETAVLGEADAICTLDSDFYSPATLDFCRALGIEVCTDTELLDRIQKQPRT